MISSMTPSYGPINLKILTFRALFTLFYGGGVRATMIERSYKNNIMKCNLFVQGVILNIELLNVCQMYSFVAVIYFSHM